MSNNLVGVKYIGGKQHKEDNVADTGAIWSQGEVINFTLTVANKLLEHKTVWELADVNPEGETYMGSKKSPASQPDPVPFINIHEMDVNALAAFSRVQFNRVIDTSLPIEEVRTLVHGYLVNNTLDESAVIDQGKEPERYVVDLEVSKADYLAYKGGVLVLKLLPVEGEAPINSTNKEPAQQEVPNVPAPIQESTPTPAPVAAEAPADEQKQEESLEESLAKLDKKALRELAKEMGITISNTMNETQLRKRILGAAAAK